MHLSTILQEAFVAECAYLKVQKLKQKENTDTKKITIQEQMVQLCLYDALATAKHAAMEAIASFATGRAQKRHSRMIRILLKPDYLNPKTIKRNISHAIIENGGYNYTKDGVNYRKLFPADFADKRR